MVNSTLAGTRQPPPRSAMAIRPGQPHSARAVSSYVPRLTRKAFEKYGFASAALLTDWASIVGHDIASFTAPERLRWPRGVDAYGDVDEGCEGRPGATLVIRVDGPRAIELQHKTHHIIDRINASFGYRAVAELRFVQAPLPKQTILSSSRPRLPAETVTDAPELRAVQDTALRGALARLYASMRRELAEKSARRMGAERKT